MSGPSRSDAAPEPAPRGSADGLQEFADSLPQPVFEVDISGRLTFLNSKAHEVFGFTADALRGGLSALDMLVAQDRERARERMRRLLAGESPPPEEFTAVSSGGTTFPVLIFSSLITRKGVPVGARGIVIDISERKRAEETLRRSEEKRRLILDHVDEIVYAVRVEDADPTRGAVEFVSARVEAITGHPAEDFLSDASLWSSLVHPEDRPSLAGATAAILASRAPGAREYRLRHRDGSDRWIEDRLVPQLDAAGRVLGYFGVARDVTERRRVEQSLRDHTRRQAAVAELGQLALATTDPDLLLQEAAGRLAQTLAVEFVHVLELRPERGDFLLRAGVGWDPGLVGNAVVPGGQGSLVGYTLSADAPVVVEDLRLTGRVAVPTLLGDHDIVSGMTVAIKTQGRPWGVLAVHSRERRAFGQDDVNFLLAVAHVIAGALERLQAEQATRHRVEMESLLASISTRFISLPAAEVDAEIGHALRFVGELAGFDRGYLIQLSSDGRRMVSTHEWCRDPVLSQVQQGLPVQAFSWSLDRLRRGRLIHVPQLRDLPAEAAAERREFERRGCESVVLLPVALSGSLLGIVGFDAVQGLKSWSAEDTRILQMLAQIFASALERRRAESARLESAELIRRAFESTPVAMALLGVDDKLLQVNETLCETLARSRAELLRTSLAEITHPEDRERRMASKRQLLAGTLDHYQMPLRLLRKDGRIVQGRLSESLVRDSKGVPLYFIGELGEISERL